MKISVITCTWNSEPWLAEAIDSVRTQDHPGVEHIFVDGGSTDRTLEIIASYGCATKVLENIQGGISRAMNEGAKVATGDVIAHLHSDDYYAGPTTLSRVADGLARSGAKWLVGRTATLCDGTIRPPLPQRPYSAFQFRSRGFCIAHPATFVDREMFLSAGMFDETLRYAMDIDLWLRLIPLADPCVLEETLTVFREHAGSLSTAQRDKARREELRVRLADPHAGVLAKAVTIARTIKTARLVK
jgi:GT2 family glycosyltransferase